MKRLVFLILLLVTYSGFSQTQTEKLKDLSVNLDLQNQDTVKVNTSIKISKLLYHSQDYVNALKFIEEGERLAASLNYKKGLAKIKHLKGLINYKKKDFINASKAFKASKLLYSNLNNLIRVAEVNIDLAILEIEQGNNTQGLKYALASTKEYNDRGDYNKLIKSYNKLIKSYKPINNNKAIVFSLKKLNVLETLNDTNRLIEANKELALLYNEEENYPKAIHYLNNALSYDENNKELQSDLLPIIGSVYTKKGAYKTATNYLKKGLILSRSTNNTNGIITALSYLGKINLKYKYLKSAEKQFLEVNTLAKQINDTITLINNYENLISLDSIRGNFERAFINQNTYHALLNSVKAKHNDSKVATKKTFILNEAPIEDSIALASNDKSSLTKINQDAIAVSKNKFDKFRKTLYISLAGFSILAICLVIAYFKRNKGLKYTRHLELKNKNIELQKEAILEENKLFIDINNTKDKLFSIVSHDLKDSLSSTKGLIDLLKEGSITKEEFNDLIPELSETANNASSLLFNLLNWSKSQMKSLESKPVTFDIKEVFEEKTKLVEQKLIAKNIMLINKLDSNLVFADRSMVEIVIQNIMTNAIKFCNSLDKITINNSVKKDRLVISIADTGVGISKENIAKLFGNDKTFTTTGTHNEKGTGLGLSICKDLIELNNGKIWVESILGVGSTFYIELPRHKEKYSFSKPATVSSAEILRPSYTEHSLLHKPQ